MAQLKDSGNYLCQNTVDFLFSLCPDGFISPLRVARRQQSQVYGMLYTTPRLAGPPLIRMAKAFFRLLLAMQQKVRFSNRPVLCHTLRITSAKLATRGIFVAARGPPRAYWVKPRNLRSKRHDLIPLTTGHRDIKSPEMAAAAGQFSAGPHRMPTPMTESRVSPRDQVVERVLQL